MNKIVRRYSLCIYRVYRFGQSSFYKLIFVWGYELGQKSKKKNINIIVSIGI